MLSAFESVSSALHSFTLLVSWDEKMRNGFEIAMRVKRPEQVSLLRNPGPSQWATSIGEKFGEIVTTCIMLIDGSDGLMCSRVDSGATPHAHSQPNLQSTLNPPPAQGHKTHKLKFNLGNEEEPLSDEAQTFFRLDATLSYYRAWVLKRSKAWLNAWAIPQFLACSQRDTALLVQLVKSRQVRMVLDEP